MDATKKTRRARIEIVPCEGSTQARDPHFLRLVASNSSILAHSETYANKANAKRAASAWLVAMSDLEWADVCEVTE